MSRELKIKAAEAAFGFVADGMRLGIGTGSTADEFIRILARHVADGLSIVGRCAPDIAQRGPSARIASSQYGGVPSLRQKSLSLPSDSR